ncbi:hypothetical protein EVAR_12612_1 [Eumeta japonica]|uniref:Gustatory receptor n=1 Tax=Eumeta variegata TaxID=151549 RepID=A0A4C1UES1_EUMVA|nr:hypothetical protein EVAR_12612_1 [Eumeta japonica]
MKYLRVIPEGVTELGLFKPCQQIQVLFSVNKYELRRHRVDPNSYRYLLTSVVVNAVVITNFYFVLSSYNFDTRHFVDYMSAVQVVIGFAEKEVDAFSFIWGFVVFTTKELFMLILVSATYEKAYSRIEELKTASAALCENRNDVALRRAAKNVMRLCSVRHAKMRVFGLFTVDAMLPLRLAGLVATYCRVIRWREEWAVGEEKVQMEGDCGVTKGGGIPELSFAGRKTKAETMGEDRSLFGSQTARKVIRLCSVCYATMRVFGLFPVDAALPLRLVGLIAAYCVVLLQFASL